MIGVRARALVSGAVLTVVLCGCGGEDASGPTSTTDGGSVPTTVAAPTSTPAPGDLSGEQLDGVVLARALVQGEDLPGFEERSVARPYSAADREGLLICGEDLRAETGLVDGVQSVLVDDAVQVTVTVSAAADDAAATRFSERFTAMTASCPEPWTQDAPLLGAGPLEAEVLGEADLGDQGVPVHAVRLRTRTEAGVSDVVVAVLTVGPLVVTVTVAGPEGADLTVAGDAVAAAARRANELVAQLG